MRASISAEREKEIDRHVKLDAQRERNKIQVWDSGRKEQNEKGGAVSRCKLESGCSVAFY